MGTGTSTVPVDDVGEFVVIILAAHVQDFVQQVQQQS